MPEASPGRPDSTPDITVDVALAAATIARQFPELAGLPIRQIGAGWDNAVFGVGREWVFRFIHRGTAVPGSAAESAVLSALPLDLPLPTPRPHFVGKPTPDLPWPFWGGPFLPGTEIGSAYVPDDARGQIADDVGRFLRRLHDPALAQTTAAAARAAGVELKVDPWGRAIPSVNTPRAREALGRLAELGLWTPDPAIFTLLDEAEALESPDGEPVLVHGDLHIRHLLVTRSQGSPRASGVIDWGDTCLGDPGIDLMIAYMAFSGPARQAFLDAYGPVDDERVLRARALAVHLAAALAEQAVRDRMSGVTAEAVAALSRASPGGPG